MVADLEVLNNEHSVLQLLGALLTSAPEKEQLELLITTDIFSHIPFSGEQEKTKEGQQALIRWMKEPLEESFAAIKSDYEDLLTNASTSPALPWESAFLQEDPTSYVLDALPVDRWYGRFKYAVEATEQVPLDHIGVQLQFLAMLTNMTIKDEQKKKPFFTALLTREMQGIKKDFLQQHALRWTAKWARLMNEHAKSDYYRGLALLVQGVLKEMKALYCEKR